MNGRQTWSRILIIVGGIAMLVGAVNPVAGALVVLGGSGLYALGAFLGQSERRLLAYRVSVFLLITIGMAATLALTSAGGFGGHSGRSMWWGLLVLPIPIGWSMGIWGPGSPRWLLVLGIVVGLWYVTIMVITVNYRNPGSPWGPWLGIVLGAIGLLAIVGCIHRLRNLS